MGIVNYTSTGDMIEIIVRDHSGAKIEQYNFNARDKKKYGSIISYLKDKYGFEPLIDPTHSVNAVNEQADVENDVDWFA